MLAETIQPIVAFMVLCSITIHGLSIPSLSLGRRVNTLSRTWSRHAPPDWTNQARLVDRGADIVINRDDIMERGDIPSTAEKAMGSGTITPLTTTIGTPEKKPEDQASLATRAGTPTEGLPDASPNGTPSVVEWEEPHHRVIERRRDSGDDVRLCFKHLRAMHTNCPPLG